MFVQVQKGTVMARLELAAVKPLFGGARSRDSRQLVPHTKRDRSFVSSS